MSNTRVVGQRLPRLDAAEKVRGEAVFAADVQLPRLLVAKILPSPYAHAEILSIDASQAEALPGVRAVITAADIPATDTYDPGNRFHAFLARRFAVYAGQPVAAVAADDLATAEAALELIGVKYRPLPVVDDVLKAIQLGSPAVSREVAPQPESEAMGNEAESPNVVLRHVFEHGDTSAVLAASDVVVEGTYSIPVVHQGYVEPHAVTAYWDRADHVTVWECVQGAFGARDLIADTLGIPHTDICLHWTEIGGGFGGKADGLFAPLAVLLAQKARRPVRLVLTRREEFIAGNPAPHTVVRLKTGAKEDGTLTALDAEVLGDVGAFSSEIPVQTLWLLGANYRFQAWRLEVLSVLTNRTPIGSYRAPGAVNAAFPIESQMDEIARQLGMDPLSLRLQNVNMEGDPLPNLRPQTGGGAVEVLTALSEHPAWTNPPSPRVGDDGLLQGRGLALGRWGSSGWPVAANAELEADGKIRFVLGTVDLTGSFTSLAQIAAEALGLSVQRIVISKASTDHAPFAPVSGGSRTIYVVGPAVQAAALDLRAKIVQRAAELLEVPEEELALNDEGVFVAANPEQACSFRRLYQSGTNIDNPRYPPLVGQGATVSPGGIPVYAASVADVVVDPETGKVTLTRLTTAQDVGKAINPLSVEGQIQGGAAQSVGVALWEEVLYDEEGQVRGPSLLDYRLPTAADLPLIETILVELPGGDGPYGAKGVGEPPMISPVAAVANAVVTAIGSRVFDLPITSERVWQALQKKPMS
jgi:CO/xanthine dehydrogenase Mo-binding subunit